MPYFYNGEQNENYKSTTNNNTDIPKMEAAADIDSLAALLLVCAGIYIVNYRGTNKKE